MSTHSNVDIIESPVQTTKEQKAKPPKMYQVILLNDDFTPMDFVIMVLQNIFNKNYEQAQSIMLKVHYQGKGLCGTYTKDIAATKVDQVRKLSVTNGHPLQCIMQVVP